MKLSVIKRDETGKQVREVRAQGMIPATVYGPKMDAASVSIDRKTFRKLFEEVGYSNLFDLKIDDKDAGRVLVKEVQYDPVSDEMLSISLYQVDMTKPITAEIPVEITGTSQAVKNNEGLLVTAVNEVTVFCLPGDLPSEFTLDVTGLNEIGDSITYEDLDLPEGVELSDAQNLNAPLVYIAAPQKALEEEVDEDEDAEGEEGEEGEGAEGEGEAEGGEGADAESSDEEPKQE